MFVLVQRHLFAVMVSLSVALHASAVLISQESVRFEPPTLLPVESGRASISLRSSAAAGPKPTTRNAADPLIVTSPPPAPPEKEPKVAPVAQPVPPEKPAPPTQQSEAPPSPPTEDVPPSALPKPKKTTPELAVPPRMPTWATMIPDVETVAQAVRRFSKEIPAKVTPKAELAPSPEPPAQPPKVDPTPAAALPSTSPADVVTPLDRPPVAKPALPESAKKTEPKHDESKSDSQQKAPPNATLADQVSQPSQGSKGSRGAQVDVLPGEHAVNSAPPYPADALASGLGGRVLLRVSIDATGKVTEVRVYLSSGVESLDQSALATVRRWQFTPARRGGVPVPFEFLKPIDFSIRGRG